MTDFSSLSLERVLYLHERIIQQSGGQQGVSDFALLHSALERCKATFAGEDLYSTLFEKAAALFHSLIMNHPFLDENKRTAYQTMKMFLYFNNVRVTASQSEIVEFCLATSTEHWKVGRISAWVEHHHQRLSD